MLMNTKKSIFTGAVVTLDLESVTLPNGQALDMEIVRHPGGAAVAAINAKNEICLLRQYRYAVQEWLWELPAGKLEPDEPPQETAKRELEEEAGVRGKNWQSLGDIVTTPAICDEVIYLYAVTELEMVETCHEPTELIEIHWVPIENALERSYQGDIHDAKTVVGIQRAAHAINEQR